MKLFALLLYGSTAIVLIHTRLDCDFESNTCDWTLVTDKSLHRSSLFKRRKICGFHGVGSSCKNVLEGDFGENFHWMIGKMSNITDQLVDYAKYSQPKLNTSELQYVLLKGFKEIDMIVFTHNLFWLNPITSDWSTSYMISDELSFSYQPSCLHYRYFLSGLTSLVVSYLTNFSNVYEDIPIKAHTSDGKTEKSRVSSLNLPLKAIFKIIFRALFNTTMFGTASIDFIKITTTRCSDSCAADEFRCNEEECVNSDLLCDGKADCLEGTDELFCYDDTEKMLCRDTGHVTRNETSSRVIENVLNSTDQSLDHLHLSNNTSCTSECEPEDMHTGMQDMGSIKLQDFTGKKLKIPLNSIGIPNNSLCSPFCPPTCECLGRSMQCVDMNCSVLIRVIALYNVTCDVVDVDRFDSRHIFTLHISNSVIGNLTISPTNTRIMFHNLHIEDTTVENIFIEPSPSKLEYLHSMELKNSTIGSSVKGKVVRGFHFGMYRKSALAFHIKSLIINFSREIVTASVNFPNDICLDAAFRDMINFSNCGLKDQAAIPRFTSQIVDVSHNFLRQYMHRPTSVTALYLQHNILSSMIISEDPSLNEYDNLEVLDISYNCISELKDGELFFAKLFYLNLRGNQIHNIDPDVFSETTKLVFLDLSRNKLSRIIIGTFLPLEFLQELYIQENEFQVSDGMFEGLKRLALLKVEFFSICCSKPKSIKKLQCIAPENSISSCDNLIDVSILSVIIWYIAFMATFGNFIVLTYNVHYLKTMPPDKYTVFILNLSLADFLMGIYLNILAIINQMYTGRYGLADYTWRHSVTCTVSGIIATLSSEASALMVFLITLDRFIAVKYPFSKLLISVKTASILSVIAWVISLLLSLIPLLPLAGFEDFYARSGICISLPLSAVRKSGWEYSMIIFVGFNFFLFLGILVGQISVFVEVLRSGRSVRSSKSMQRERTLAVSVFGVVLTDVLCWIPIGTIGMLTFFGMAVPPDVYAWIIVVVLPINSALNPLIYTLNAVLSRMRKRESDIVSQLKHQVAYWKSKNGYPSDATELEIHEGNTTQKKGP